MSRSRTESPVPASSRQQSGGQAPGEAFLELLASIVDDYEVIDGVEDQMQSVNTFVGSFSNGISHHECAGNRNDRATPRPRINRRTETITETRASSAPFYQERHSSTIIEAIYADFQAAQRLAQEEVKLLKTELMARVNEAEVLRRTLNGKAVQSARIIARCEESERMLQEASMKLDELVASKIECDDIIKVQQTTIDQLRSNGNFSGLPVGLIRDKTLLSSLREKEQHIDELRSELQEVAALREREHNNVLSLEEIVKILNGQILEVEQRLQHTRAECEAKIEQMRTRIAEYEMSNSNNANRGTDTATALDSSITTLTRDEGF